MNALRYGRCFTLALVAALLLPGCATPPLASLEGARDEARTELEALGVAGDPMVDSRREELAAAEAEERELSIVDGLELRASASAGAGGGESVRARLRFADPFGLPSRRQARRAASQAALERLRAMGLERRADRCFPELGRRAEAERAQIFERFAERQRQLRGWNDELEQAGLVDEVDSARFVLSSQVRLGTRAPAPELERTELEGVEDALPTLEVDTAPLVIDEDLIRGLVTQHQPSWATERAMAERYRALASAERAARWPSPRFLDASYQPGQGRRSGSTGLQLGIEIPFGPAPAAREARAAALARSHESRSRGVLEDRTLLAREALAVVRHFEARREQWRTLLVTADASEATADRWRRDRLAEPARIARLIDDVYDARSAVLKEQERAGVAGCSLWAATGVPVDAWPRETEVGR